MAAKDYNYDPSGRNPDNYIEHEVHDIVNSVGIVPQHGAFFYDSLMIEAYVEERWVPLTRHLDYRAGAPFLTASLNTGKNVTSFLVLQRSYNTIRISYQALGEYEDTATLALIQNSTFDRRDSAAWLNAGNANTVDVSDIESAWKGMGEAEAVNQGLVKIREALSAIKPSSDKATLAQITNLETRQSRLEQLVDTSEVSNEEIASEFAELWELFHILEDYFINGGKGNTSYPDGYLYNSNGAAEFHLINHGFNTQNLHVDFWEMGDEGKYIPGTGSVSTIGANQLTYASDGAKSVIGVIRPANSEGYVSFFEVTSPIVKFPIPHNLNTGFLGITVWKDRGDGEFETSNDYRINMIDENNVEFTGAPAGVYRVVVEPPTPNAFAYKSQPAKREHLITHYLETTYYVATIWKEDFEGNWYTEPEKPTTQLASLNHINVELATLGNVKVVLHPVGVESVNFDVDLLNKLTQIEDVQSRIETKLSVLTSRVAALETPDHHDYHAPAAYDVHTIEHPLSSLFVTAHVWVQQDDETYQPEEALVRIVDKDLVTVTLTEERLCRVRIRRH